MEQAASTMKDLTIFVSSSDDYEDCWYPFFFLLKKFWPDCDLPIILNTENKSFSFEGLNITCTRTGKQSSFGKTFQTGLDHVKTDNLILLMIDYFIMQKVEVGHLAEAHHVFLKEKLDGLYLIDTTTIKETSPLSDHYFLVTTPGVDRFNFQAALWNKASLRKYVLPHENPWMSEMFGSERYRYSHDRIAYVGPEREPFKYLATGALHKGGWIPETVPDLERLGLKLDWSRRGFYKWKQPSLSQRLKKRRATLGAEIRTRLHLLGLKLGLTRLS